MTRSAIIYSHDSVFSDAFMQIQGNVASIIEKGDCSRWLLISPKELSVSWLSSNLIHQVDCLSTHADHRKIRKEEAQSKTRWLDEPSVCHIPSRPIKILLPGEPVGNSARLLLVQGPCGDKDFLLFCMFWAAAAVAGCEGGWGLVKNLVAPRASGALMLSWLPTLFKCSHNFVSETVANSAWFKNLWGFQKTC